MSIKDLFKSANKVFNGSPEKLKETVESGDFVSAKLQNDRELVPEADYAKPENFARFGLAENYYKDAIALIRDTYPYDGSEKEKYEWLNKLTYLEKYIFDNLYPKSTGYITLNKNSALSDTLLTTKDSLKFYNFNGQYVSMVSGPNTGDDVYRTGNVYSPSNKQRGNLDILPDDGNTVELWFKFSDVPSSANSIFCILDLWNWKPVVSPDYSRLTIDISPTSEKLFLTYKVGAEGIVRKQIPLAGVDIKNWNHYAVSFKNAGTGIQIFVYINGEIIYSGIDGTKITSVSSTFNRGIVAQIGKFIATPLTANPAVDIGVLLGSVDEFRFWKSERTQKDIKQHLFDRVYGGTNTDLSNTSLGVYYRFNEGIVDPAYAGVSSTAKDATVLDYSGRLTNGTINNYNNYVRSESSAVDESGLFVSKEPSDPIVYSSNQKVIDLAAELDQLGRQWDEINTNSIYRSLPEWIVEEDEQRAQEELKALCQIVGTYLDKVYLQIKVLPSLSFQDYFSEKNKQIPFQKSILESNGMVGADIFVESTILEDLRKRNENLLFEEDLSNLRNLVYKNIYNNLTHIYKTKGSEKSFRNLIRCFGIDDELLRANIYANNTTYSLEASRRETVLRRKVINLSTPDNYAGSVISYADPLEANQMAWVGSADPGQSAIGLDLIPLTYEVEVVFPAKPNQDDVNFSVPNSLRISLFGGRTEAGNDPAVYNVSDTAGAFNFSVTLVKNSTEDLGGYFEFFNSATGQTLQSEYFQDIYSDEKWNFAVRLKIDERDFSLLKSDPTIFNGNVPHFIELYGVSIVGDNIRREFALTSSQLQYAYIAPLHQAKKRFYVGARKSNLNGSTINPTDIYFVRSAFWFDYLTNQEIISHAKDVTNYGLNNPQEKRYISAGETFARAASQVFMLGFDNILTSDINGGAVLTDAKQSVPSETDSLFLSTNIAHSYPAKLVGITIPNSSDIVKKYYTVASKNQTPENLYSVSTVSVSGDTDTAFTKDTLPSNMFLAFEKSLYNTISDEMLTVFSDIEYFNTLIGQPINKYRVEYRELTSLREKFFANVKNTPNLERYLELYKWIDNSVASFINETIPAGIDSSREITNVIESHVLERPKYDYKLPQLEERTIDYGQIKGIKELKYSWAKGHGPSGELWLKERADRTDDTLFPGQTDEVQNQRQKVINSITNETGKRPVKVYDTRTATIYDKTPYYDRRLARVVDTVGKKIDIHSDAISPYSIKNGNKIQTGARENNPKYFVDTNGSLSLLSRSPLFGSNDPLPTRKVYKTIFASRFSSPGSRNETNRGALDPISETLSIYSTINERNRIVKNQNKLNLSATYSIDPNSPSIHKINDNSIEIGGLIHKDNWFVQYQIPRADNFTYTDQINKFYNTKYRNLFFCEQKKYSKNETLGIGEVIDETFRACYKEPPVEWNTPLQIDITEKLKVGEILSVEDLTAKNDYSNVLDRFANPNISNILFTFDKSNKIAAFQSIYNLYMDYVSIEEGLKIKKIKYSERILPRKEKVGLKEVRGRTAYLEAPGPERRKNIATINTIWDLDVYARRRSIGAEATSNSGVIVAQSPSPQEINCGGNIALFVQVLCSEDYEFQWEKSLDGNTWQDIPNENSPIYYASGTTIKYAGQYRVKFNLISNPSDIRYSDVIVVNFASGVITNQTTGPIEKLCGEDISLSVAIKCPTEYTFKWQKSLNGTSAWADISAATSLTYAKNPVGISDTGFYRLEYIPSDGSSDMYSAVVQVTVSNRQFILCTDDYSVVSTPMALEQP